MRIALIVSALTLALFLRPAEPQSPTGTDESGRITVPVIVKTARGELASGLEAGDFHLYEDGREQRIQAISVAPRPLCAAILIDGGLNLATAQRIRATFPSLAQAFGEEDVVGVFSFQTALRAVADFTSDQEKIYRSLKSMDVGGNYGLSGGPLGASGPVINGQPVLGGGPAPAGQAAPSRTRKNIDDSVFAAVQALEGRPPDRRKIIFLITDGANSGHNDVSTSSLLNALRRSGVQVYSIGVDNARLLRGSALLSRLASASGGESFTALKQNSIEALYSRITEEARYQYVLSYAPPKPEGAAPAFHSIAVRLSKPGLIPIARDGCIR